MKTTRMTMLLGLLLALGAGAQEEEHAQGGKTPPPPPRPPMSPLFAAIDLDRDGRLSATEIQKAPEGLAALDKNGNGRLTEKELMPPPPKEGDNGGQPQGDGRRRPNKGGEQAEGPQGPPPGGDAEGPHGPPPGPRPPKDGEGPQGPPPAGQDGEQKGPRPPRPHGPSPLMLILDKNGDGTLSNKEIEDAAGVLAECDQNGDGGLTMDELRPKNPPAGGFGPGGMPPHGPGPGGPGPGPGGPGGPGRR